MADFSWVPEELTGRFSYENGRLVASCEVCGATRQTSGKGAVLRDIAAGKIDRFKRCGLHGKYKGMKPSPQDVASWPEGHKRCTDCKEIKPFSEFHKHRTALFGYNTVCKACRVPISKVHHQNTSYEHRLFHAAKSRATRKNREFSIELSDIQIPAVCPVLGVPIVLKAGSDYAPSLDRIDSSRGYVKGNVIVMSKRANTLKNNMTLEEAQALVAFLTDNRYSSTVNDMTENFNEEECNVAKGV
jgi:hypothetical protein